MKNNKSFSIDKFWVSFDLKCTQIGENHILNLSECYIMAYGKNRSTLHIVLLKRCKFYGWQHSALSIRKLLQQLWVALTKFNQSMCSRTIVYYLHYCQCLWSIKKSHNIVTSKTKMNQTKNFDMINVHRSIHLTHRTTKSYLVDLLHLSINIHILGF